jgi:hypothetical protein
VGGRVYTRVVPETRWALELGASTLWGTNSNPLFFNVSEMWDMPTLDVGTAESVFDQLAQSASGLSPNNLYAIEGTWSLLIRELELIRSAAPADMSLEQGVNQAIDRLELTANWQRWMK